MIALTEEHLVIRILVVVGQYLSIRTLSGVTVLLFISMAFLFYRFGGTLYRRMESRFLAN